MKTKTANAQKNTLLKNAASHPQSNFFKRVFFSPTQEEFFPPQFFLLFFPPKHGLSRKPKVTASNVNRFGQSVCKLDMTHLRTDSKPAHNKGLKEMAGEVVNQTFVHLINGCGRLTVPASKTSIL
ncbi:MAG: hypothetical protein IPI96_14985 [Saprospiraceae bacterium]|nr:hypothetical protein [Saprospiraceae bacterium]